MSFEQESGQPTGTKDKDDDILRSTQASLDDILRPTQASLDDALRLETDATDAERDGDTELAEFFRRAQGESRTGAEQGEQLLAGRLT